MSEVVVFDQLQDFATLEEEWEDLYQNAALPTPFQSWPWLYSWWEFYGKSYELRLVTIRDGGLLVGLMPLMLERRGGFGRLLFVGTGLTDYQDMLVREGWERQAVAAGVRALGQIDGWQVADLQQLRSGAVAWGIFEGWAGPRARVWQDNFPVIDVKPWDELLMSLSKNLRSTVRRTLRRAEADGVRCELAGADEVERASQRWIALHREAWRGRDIDPEHLTRRFESHLETAACRMTVRGLGGISEFWRDGEVIISHFLVFGRDFVAEHLPGARQDALQRYQLSSLCIWDAMNIARGAASSYLDLLRGEEEYKLRWSSRVVPNYRAILGRRRVLWAPYAGYQVLHSWGRRYASSEGAPPWIQKAANNFRTLRHWVARNVNL
ncbi:MAG: GNAT family N-acetyltransferase [Rubrobacter sp.]|nr:GNAT family N-acetyltransferase [Rubrobacter sp.]